MAENTEHTEINELTPEAEADEKALRKRTKQRKRVRRHKRWMRYLTGFMVIVVGIYCAVGIFGLTYAGKLLKGMPELNINDFISPESSKIYDGNGGIVEAKGSAYGITHDRQATCKSIVAIRRFT